MRLVVKLSMAAALVAVSATAAAQTMAVVDMQKVFAGAPQVQKIKSALQTKFTVRKAALQKQGQALQADIMAFEKNKAVMSASNVTKTKKKITAEGAAFHQAQLKYQSDLMSMQATQTKQLLVKIKAVVSSEAKKQHVDVVFPEQAVLYSSGMKNLTPAVIADLKG